MPKTKFEKFIFAVIMTFIMVYAMICYNIALNNGGMADRVFGMAFGELWIMWPAAILIELFAMEKLIVYLTQRVVTKEMPVFFVLLIRSSITVCLMCPAMSLVGTFLFKDFHQAGLIGTWLQTAALNFPMALCWQFFFGGPAGRLVFRKVFRKRRNGAEETVE